MSNDHIEKQALVQEVMEHIPGTDYYGQKQLSKGSESYKTALSMLKNLNKSIESAMNVQKGHLRFVERYGKAMKLQDFAKHVDAFLREQAKIVSVATNKELSEKFNKLLEAIDSELYGQPTPFDYDVNEFVAQIDATTSMPSNIATPPSVDWKPAAQAILNKRIQKASSELNDMLFKEAGIIGKWYGNRYYGDLKRGKTLKGAITQITDLVKRLYEINKEKYKQLKSSFAKGDPDEYYDYLKQLANATASGAAGILPAWNNHFEKYMVAAEAAPTPEAERDVDAGETPPVEQPDVTEPSGLEVEDTSNPADEFEDAAQQYEDAFEDSEQALSTEDAAQQLAEPAGEVPPGPHALEPITPHKIISVRPPSAATLSPLEYAKHMKEKEQAREEGAKVAEEILEGIYKNAANGDIYAVAQGILQLAEDADANGDSDLAAHLTRIAEEAFDDES